jgi:DNA-binding GntR family transcriptional regulator
LQQHQDITDSLLARNAENAAAAMRAHIETAIENLATQSDEQETSE